MGEVVGSYRILERIGEGAVGVVYLAEHILIGRKAAVKMLHPAMAGTHDVVHRFFNEARAVAMLKHPGLVDVYDFGFVADRAFLVMEYLEGRSLRAAIKALGKFPLGKALATIRQIASAVGTAHKQGIVHRDLKPDNVMLVADGEHSGKERAKVVDFGVAKLTNLGSGMGITRLGTVMGTPLYMAPEQCRGLTVDLRADIYSLGCIAFEIMTGHLPFDESTVADVLAAHIKRPPPRLRSFEPKIPKAIELVVLSMLAKSPDERPATMDAVIAALDDADEGWLAAELGHGSRPTGESITGDEHPSAHDLTVVELGRPDTGPVPRVATRPPVRMPEMLPANAQVGESLTTVRDDNATSPKVRISPVVPTKREDLATTPKAKLPGPFQAAPVPGSRSVPPGKQGLPAIPLDPKGVTPAPPGARGAPVPNSSRPQGVGTVTRIVAALGLPSGGSPGAAAKGSGASATGSAASRTAHPAGATTYQTLQRMIARRTWFLLAGGVIVVALGIGAITMGTGGGDDGSQMPLRADLPVATPPDAAPADTLDVPPLPVADAHPTLVMVRIESTPSQAAVYRASDGVFLGRTPFVDRVAEAERTQLYIVRRPGYQDELAEVDQAGIAVVTLKPLAARTVAPVRTPPPNRPPAPKQLPPRLRRP